MKKPCVLIVEDNVEFGQTCVQLLLEHNFDVLYCDNADKAKPHILNEKIDIAIIDLMLPPTFQIEGIDLYRYIKEKNKLLPVIFMTTKEFNTIEIVAEAMKLGAEDFLDKNNSIFSDKLIATIIGSINKSNIEHKPDMGPQPEFNPHPSWAYMVSVTSGLIFIAIMLLVAIFIATPTPFQMFIFRVVISLAAGGFGAALPGFFNLNLPIWKKGMLHAGGALGLFAIVYLINPPSLLAL
jgi:CheY-like chemotaxis protein